MTDETLLNDLDLKIEHKHLELEETRRVAALERLQQKRDASALLQRMKKTKSLLDHNMKRNVMQRRAKDIVEFYIEEIEKARVRDNSKSAVSSKSLQLEKKLFSSYLLLGILYRQVSYQEKYLSSIANCKFDVINQMQNEYSAKEVETISKMNDHNEEILLMKQEYEATLCDQEEQYRLEQYDQELHESSYHDPLYDIGEESDDDSDKIDTSPPPLIAMKPKSNRQGSLETYDDSSSESFAEDEDEDSIGGFDFEALPPEVDRWSQKPQENNNGENLNVSNSSWVDQMYNVCQEDANNFGSWHNRSIHKDRSLSRRNLMENNSITKSPIPTLLPSPGRSKGIMDVLKKGGDSSELASSLGRFSLYD